MLTLAMEMQRKKIEGCHLCLEILYEHFAFHFFVITNFMYILVILRLKQCPWTREMSDIQRHEHSFKNISVIQLSRMS